MDTSPYRSNYHSSYIETKYEIFPESDIQSNKITFWNADKNDWYTYDFITDNEYVSNFLCVSFARTQVPTSSWATKTQPYLLQLQSSLHPWT